MSATTHVKPDGSYTRIVRFTASNDTSKPLGGGLRDTFVLPAGTPWKVTKAKDKDETVYEAQQAVLCGQTIRQDVVLKGDGKSNVRALTNEVSVRSIGPGRFEYREVLHGQGDRKGLEQCVTALTEGLKAVLPASPTSDADCRRVAHSMFKEMWQSLFGPSEPLIAIGLMHPDLAERKMSQRLGPAIKQTLTEVYGDHIPLLQRGEIMRNLTSYANKMSRSQKDQRVSGGKSASKSSSGDSTAGLVPLLFAVRCPGKILTSNGLYDETQNEVFWALYPEAATFEDVVLTATWQVDDRGASR
jgi:hypothetical protein